LIHESLPKHPALKSLRKKTQFRRKAVSDRRKIYALDTETTQQGELLVLADNEGNYIDLEKSKINHVLKFLFSKRYEGSWCFFYNLHFDARIILKMILRELSEKDLNRFYYTFRCKIQGYSIHYIEEKKLSIRKGKHSVTFFDIAQFYSKSLLEAYKTNIKKPLPNHYESMKESRSDFSKDYYKRHKKQMRNYCIDDCILTKELAEHWCDIFYKAFLFYPSHWISSGYLAEKVLINQGVNVTKFDDIHRILDTDYSGSSNMLEGISNKIKNLLKIGFSDGVKRSEQYFKQKINFYNYWLRQEQESFSRISKKDIFYEKMKWHSSRIHDVLDEVTLIKDSQKEQDELSYQDQQNEKPLEFDVSHEDHTGKIKVFISHKFVEFDQKLAETLQNSLKEHNIYGYLAERKKEYDLGWDEKIKLDINSSDYLVAILTKHSLYAPSVHQEIGYAIGVKVPIRILVEEEEVKGVLAQGRDSEKFSRSDFEKYLGNIITDVKKKGIRKKLDNELKQKLDENVYVPCYNQMINVHQNMDFIDNVPENPWKNIPSNWKLNTEDDIKQLFIQYTQICDEWEKLRSDFIQNFSERKSKLIPIIVNAFRKCKLMDKNDHIILDDTTIEPHYWLEAFRMVLFDWNVTSGEELYQSLYNYAKNSKNGHDKWIKQWWDSNNGIHSNIFEIIPELINTLDSPITKKMLDEKRTELRESIMQLTLALENKTKIN